ncbi:uncharacterized protein LOC130798945 [Amaranthus tricolor]|uniref:uncharacterized protein LOC130798945 n=1 Tax=Amaranthus tricolor TaxID=29722 RepID=UPI002584C633|nr:uncharacterized protein LOC130798945 [Amaranthus tricolor]
MRTIPKDENVFFGGDFNGHIGRDAANSILRKKDEHLITYKSGGHTTQVEYFLVRKGDRASCLDCMVVLGIEMPTQHRFLVLVFRMRKKIVEKKVESRGKIMWGRLKGDMVTTLSSKISLLGFPSQSEDANEMWVKWQKPLANILARAPTLSRGERDFKMTSMNEPASTPPRLPLRRPGGSDPIPELGELYTDWQKRPWGGPKKADNQISVVERPLEYGSTSDITTKEVGEALKKMERTKAVGPDNISIEDDDDDNLIIQLLRN